MGALRWTRAPRRTRVRAPFAVALGLMLALTAGGLHPGESWAIVHPAAVLDGPANDIVDVDGAAMAPDGSGAIVYRKVLGTGTHVFVDQFLNGAWRAPIQVDTGNPFTATTPAIVAGEGGRLLVVWVQPRNLASNGATLYELTSASLQPGAAEFGPAVVVDPNVGEPVTGDVSAVNPSLAMDPSGQAYVVYRVITNACQSGDSLSSACIPGSSDELVDVRVARFNYLRWSLLGAINRASQIAMRNPTPANAPAIGIDLNGNGVVAWQEPGIDGVARIWARRLFGVVPGNVLQASPETIAGKPVTSDADAPTVAVSDYGAARIVYRIHGSPGSAVATTQLYENSISSELGLKAAQLTGATPVPGAAQPDLGVPDAAIDKRGDFRLAWTQGAGVQELSGGEEGSSSPVAIGSAVPQEALTTINPAGGGTTAWPTAAGGLPVVDVREDYAQGAFQLTQQPGSIAGPVGGLSLGGSGQGDALLGWSEGSVGQSEVLGDFVQAPPAPFNLTISSGWVRSRQASVSWEAAPDAVSGVTYTVYVDGKARVRGLAGLAARLSSAALGDGVHQAQVLATDRAGQQTMSAKHALKVDANPPVVKLARSDHGRGVRITLRDDGSGVAAASTRVSFGDGQHARGHAVMSHVYAGAGTYTIQALVRDKVGNHATVYLRVKVS